MSGFVCPVCREELFQQDKSLKCIAGHCFDISKFGYVNLLMSSQSSAKRHGDDRLMVRARRDFLDKGYYAFLCEKLCEICIGYLDSSSIILDAGCGECYYSAAIGKVMCENGKNSEVFGVDISKDALEFAFKRKSGVTTAVASVFNMPVADSSVDAVLNIFSPEAFAEFCRVLKPDGILIRVIPLEKHLLGLKKAVYDKPYLNQLPEAEIEGFKLKEEIVIKDTIMISSNEDINNLFKMTPYYYKTGINDQQKLASLESVETEAEFGIRIYRKENRNA